MSAYRYLLFPYSTASDRDFRYFSLLVPRLSMVRVIRTPSIPEWAAGLVEEWPVDLSGGREEMIRSCLRGYQEFAVVNADNILEASRGNEAIFRNSCESRFHIQGGIRGKNTAADPKETALMDAATFLEMALDLDEREKELEANFSRMDELEGEFREILGLGTDEGNEDVAQALSLNLTSQRANLSFMLRRRMTCWFEAFSSRPDAVVPALVTMNPDIPAELLDPIKAGYERAGKALNVVEFPICSLPVLDRLPSKVFETLQDELNSSGTAVSLKERLDELLSAAPGAGEAPEGVLRAGWALGNACDDFLRKAGFKASGRMQFTLTCFPDHKPADLWKHLDEKSYASRLRENALEEGPSLFLHLELQETAEPPEYEAD